MTKSELARKIDHTILAANATFEEVRSTILYAREIGAASVCLNPAYISLAADLLEGSDTVVCTVIGFPLGANSTYTKAAETRNAYCHGAREMDMVINISALKCGDYEYVKNDIEAVVNASPALVKVILENCYLTKEEIAIACRLATEAGAEYVKTSTGFGPSGATAQDVALMKNSITSDMKVKAAGGIRNLEDALAMLDAGASRIGMSKTAAVLTELDVKNATAKPSTDAKKAPVKKSATKSSSSAKKAPTAKKAAAVKKTTKTTDAAKT